MTSRSIAAGHSIHPLGLLLLTLLAFLLAAPASAQAPKITGPKVGELRTQIPARQGFVVHGTMPVPAQTFRRQSCPYVVVDPDGRVLQTQWEEVARLEDFLVVELMAYAENPGSWSGEETFAVHEGTTPFDGWDYDPSILEALQNPNHLRLVWLDQSGNVHELGLTSQPVARRVHRNGPIRVTIEQAFVGPWGGLQVWITIERGRSEVDLTINWNNGILPARADYYFKMLMLDVAAGLRWTPVLPDPAMDYPLLVKKGHHVLPQRWERPFRVVVHADGATPDLSQRGWAVGDWSDGGYMAQSLKVPDLSHCRIDLAPKKNEDFDLLANVQPTAPGSPPVSYLYPAQGVYYGGMTGGAEVYQYPEIPLVCSGQPDGLLSVYVEQLRYAARQKGCIYEQDGEPIDQDDYLNPDGSQPFDLFNNEFIGYPPKDAPFYFTKTGPGVGSASYDPNDFLPIDYQHYVRRTKANKALVWLDNDPLARRYLMMDAELGRMCFYEGPDGRLDVPTSPGLGTSMGRGEAWVGDTMATAWALAPSSWRSSRRDWFDRFVDILRTAQMPNELFSALNFGKTATSPPYGDGKNAFYWVHRSNEQIFLMHAMRGFQETVGVDCSDLIRTCGQALWDFAWKVGTDGPLDAYPAGPIGAPRYSSRSQIPAGLTSTVTKDNWHVPNALANAEREGAKMVQALLAYTQTTSIQDAKAQFLRWELGNIANRADALSLIQELVP